MQIALARYVDPYRHFCIPNCMAGYFTECDFLVVSKSGLLWEIEIKCSMADWKADLAKHRQYKPGWNPARFYYAYPEDNPHAQIPEWVPMDAGVLWIFERDGDPVIRPVRAAKARHRCPVSDDIKIEILRKIHLRYWLAFSSIQNTSPTTPQDEGK